jgi:hypothetical protein
MPASAAHVHEVAGKKGRPMAAVLSDEQINYAVRLCDVADHSISQFVEETGVPRTILPPHLPPRRPGSPPTAAPA